MASMGRDSAVLNAMLCTFSPKICGGARRRWLLLSWTLLQAIFAGSDCAAGINSTWKLSSVYASWSRTRWPSRNASKRCWHVSTSICIVGTGAGRGKGSSGELRREDRVFRLYTVASGLGCTYCFWFPRILSVGVAFPLHQILGHALESRINGVVSHERLSAGTTVEKHGNTPTFSSRLARISPTTKYSVLVLPSASLPPSVSLTLISGWVDRDSKDGGYGNG